MVHWPISASGMSHFLGGNTSSGGRDYATTGEVNEADVPSTAGAFAALKRLQEQGKVKHIGVSNFGVNVGPGGCDCAKPPGFSVQDVV